MIQLFWPHFHEFLWKDRMKWPKRLTFMKIHERFVWFRTRQPFWPHFHENSWKVRTKSYETAETAEMASSWKFWFANLFFSFPYFYGKVSFLRKIKKNHFEFATWNCILIKSNLSFQFIMILDWNRINFYFDLFIYEDICLVKENFVFN